MQYNLQNIDRRRYEQPQGILITTAHEMIITAHPSLLPPFTGAGDLPLPRQRGAYCCLRWYLTSERYNKWA
jgi:hypothetical protein